MRIEPWYGSDDSQMELQPSSIYDICFFGGIINFVIYLRYVEFLVFDIMFMVVAMKWYPETPNILVYI